MGEAVQEYNTEHKSRATKMASSEMAQNANHDTMKETLEANREGNNPQPRLEEGDKVKTRLKKKFEKGYKPDWSEKLYTVASRIPRNAARLVPKHPVPMGEDMP